MSGILLSNYSQTSVQAGEKSPSDFLFFNYDASLNTKNYKVLLEDLAGKWVNLGNLSKRVLIPATHFPAKAMLVVLGTNSSGQQVRHSAEFNRGHLYLVGKEMAGDQHMRHVIPQYHN